MKPQSRHVHRHDSFISHVKGLDIRNKFLPVSFLDFFKKWLKYEEKNPAYESESCTSVITSIVVGGPTLALECVYASSRSG
jgi:hypothetical protein